MKALHAAYSPCPNDTFLFHAWSSGLVGQDIPIETTLADIEQLNSWAREGCFDIIKISFAALPFISEYYQMLPVGAALGFNCGPKIVTKAPFDLKEMASKIVAIPGEQTTAHLLLNHFAPPPKNKIFCPFHETTRLLKQGQADCALIIHEQRFTFERDGFIQIADLGELWQQRYGVPLPLGCIAVRKELSESAFDQIVNALTDSLEYGWSHPKASLPYIFEHSREKEPKVVHEHISTYVTAETRRLSPEALSAIQTLLNIGTPCASS